MSFDSFAAIAGALVAIAVAAITVFDDFRQRRAFKRSLLFANRATERGRLAPRNREEAVERAQQALEDLEDVELPAYAAREKIRSIVDKALQDETAQLRRYPPTKQLPE